MAKNSNTRGFVFGLIVSLCLVGFGYAKPDTRRLELQKVYSSQIGVQELTGHNDGVEVEGYLKSCGLRKGNPWCAAFITWCFEKSGINAIQTAYAPLWFPKAKVVPLANAKAGDVVGFYFRDKHRIAHVGFFDAFAGAFAITVEGNTSASASIGTAASRDGDGVFKKRRLKRQIYIVSKWL